MRTYKLNNGLEMPRLGLGVWQSENGKETIDAIHWALEAGYRHVDTAKAYRNEEAVGEAIRTAGLPREEVWLTTKVWNDDIRAGRTTEALDNSLKRLKLDYVDQVLLHWPVEGRVAAWQELEKALEAGKVRSIGVSNFMDDHIEEIIEAGSVLPVVNQIEYHPYLTQADAISACDAHDIAITAWSPLMQGHFLKEPLFAEIGERYGKTAAQVVLRWCLQNDVIVIPKSVHRKRIIENGDLFDFELSEEDMVAIDELERGKRFGPDPRNFDF
ncbi:diketogulonate reductase-like aldo/keto reductase [Lewinella marina]|uniref:Aldo/keto reductase n=1 Tax=Neolewinella marina TaxID=438751 RepID=A0A2G0CE03_9BACT|nr:aldo/keto reductase [Neolewinella marina]NJB87488.1 diketogulonate reductase-like aldo/keto reductase [Neolewinella marina]PHK98206.1 aldo/keto reductase [Neolewinella marina]